MKKIVIALLSVVMLGAMFSSCDSKQKRPPVDLNEKKEQAEVTVPYSELGGVKTIPVKLNGVSMDMIFDTGCSGMSISLNELLTMIKNGRISEADFTGSTTRATIADGSVVENGQVILREVEIGGKDGIVVHNVRASIARNPIAPVLLGNGVIDAVASVEVDNIHKTIKFKRR